MLLFCIFLLFLLHFKILFVSLDIRLLYYSMLFLVCACSVCTVTLSTILVLSLFLFIHTYYVLTFRFCHSVLSMIGSTFSTFYIISSLILSYVTFSTSLKNIYLFISYKGIFAAEYNSVVLSILLLIYLCMFIPIEPFYFPSTFYLICYFFIVFPIVIEVNLHVSCF